MELGIRDRLKLIDVMADARMSFRELKAVRRLKAELVLTDEEREAVGYREFGGRAFWDDEREQPVDVEVRQVALEAVVRRLQELDEARGLTQEMETLYELFMGVEPEEEAAT